ncbi:MAG: zinc-binding alcohol dehydrogenase, partial [Aquisalimonadaceae bacterium]
PESQYAAMRAPFQEGEFPGPVKYGYINVGEVQEGPDPLLGKQVFCLFPHQDRYVVPATAVTPLPEGLPAARAVLTANMETAVNAVWDAAPGLGDRISVIGAGVVGCLAAALCSAIPGTRVELIDTDPGKAEIARALGLSFCLPADAAMEADLVLHASGNPAGLDQALRIAGMEARIVEVSWFGSQAVSLPLGEHFHSRRLRIRSSQVGRLPPERAPRWDHGRRLRLAMELLIDPVFDNLITGESAFEQLPETLAELATRPGGSLCHRIRYPD